MTNETLYTDHRSQSTNHSVCKIAQDLMAGFKSEVFLAALSSIGCLDLLEKLIEVDEAITDLYDAVAEEHEEFSGGATVGPRYEAQKMGALEIERDSLERKIQQAVRNWKINNGFSPHLGNTEKTTQGIQEEKDTEKLLQTFMWQRCWDTDIRTADVHIPLDIYHALTQYSRDEAELIARNWLETHGYGVEVDAYPPSDHSRDDFDDDIPF